jgi:hypothetical protein
MQILKARWYYLFATLILIAGTVAGSIYGQETRGTIRGRVLDTSQAVVIGASVTVENVDTGTATRLTTNDAGYYEATLLLPGNYRISAEITGFKKTVRSGVALPMSGSLEINLTLEVGGITETVSVTAAAPLLETSGLSSGMILDNRSVMDLPVIANNVMVLVKLSPGLYTNGVNDYLGPHSISGASNYSTGGSVGGNEWSIDGVPNNGANRQTAYLPHADTVQEVKVETSNFDAAIGHTTGASVTMMTRSGTNQYHGSVTEQHWQQRWQATNFFTNQAYYRSIADALAKGDQALADKIRNTPKQDSGRSNNYAATIGGPIRIPKLFDGRDHLFFFFSYQGNKDQVADLPSRMNTTIPTLDDRDGNFARFLAIDPVRYQIYDPLTVRVDPARSGHYIRDPFAGNVIPKTRFNNPTHSFYSKILPTPNNDFDPKREPLNNYLSNAPLIRNYKAYSNRIDYHMSEKHRFFGRWSWNDWSNYAADWTYKTMKGLQSLSQSRTNLGSTVDWVYTISPTTIMDVAVAYNAYRDGNRPEVARQFKPSDAGFPAYMDEKAGDQHILPVLNLSGYNSISTTYPAYTYYRNLSGRVDVTHVRKNHTIHAGYDMRMQYRLGGGGGNTSGTFGYSNAYTRKNDDTFTPAGNLAHSWAAYLLGLPDTMTTAIADSYAMINPYYAWFVQDTWRLSRKLTLNAGLRLEYELGPTERFNRMIAGFNPKATLPISTAAQAAYAKNPIPELDASKFSAIGGSLYAGTAGADRKLWKNELMWMPRLSAAYQVNAKTVIQGGYGMFYDTLNVLNQGPDQLGYSRTTSSILTTDFGVNWLIGNPRGGVSPLTDPFPVRSDKTRFDLPTSNSLGLMAKVGRGFNYVDFDAKHARQHRWRIGVQRQLTGSMVVDVAYSGLRVSRIPLSQTLSPLPEQFWATGNVRNDAIATNLNSNVTNPFRITNFASLQSSDPLQYQNMNTLSFFTSSTIRKNLLLRAFPQMNGLTQTNAPAGKSQSDTLEINFMRRFSKGLNLNFGYTWSRSKVADYYKDEFDPLPSWELSNDTRPHRIVATGIYQLPFGKGRTWAQSGPLNYLLGGFQIAVTYEYQPGPLIDWGNLFYYGNQSDIALDHSSIERWFNTDNFERTSSKMPAAYHRRIFPTRIEGVRTDNLDQWNANIQRDFKLREGLTLQLRMDALNVLNATQFAGPNVSPASTDFGKVSSQTNTTKRFLQLQARIRF